MDINEDWIRYLSIFQDTLEGREKETFDLLEYPQEEEYSSKSKFYVPDDNF